MQEYEVVFIIKATQTDEAIDALVQQMQDVVKGMAAEVVNVDKWGRRKLAYEIGKERDGFYVLFHLRASGTAIAELERKFRMSDAVVRFLTVRIDEELRRARRRAAMRARKKGIEGAAMPVPTSRPRDLEVPEEASEVEPEEEEGEA